MEPAYTTLGMKESVATTLHILSRFQEVETEQTISTKKIELFVCLQKSQTIAISGLQYVGRWRLYKCEAPHIIVSITSLRMKL